MPVASFFTDTFIPAAMAESTDWPFSVTVQPASRSPPDVNRASAYSPFTGASPVVGNVALMEPLAGAANHRITSAVPFWKYR